MGRRATPVGRERESALLSAFLDGGADVGLVLTGEAGVVRGPETRAGPPRERRSGALSART